MGVGVTTYYQTFPELFAFLYQSPDQRIWGVFLFKGQVGRWDPYRATLQLQTFFGASISLYFFVPSPTTLLPYYPRFLYKD